MSEGPHCFLNIKALLCGGSRFRIPSGYLLLLGISAWGRHGAAHARRDMYGTARGQLQSPEWPGGTHQVVGQMLRALVLILYLHELYISLNCFGGCYGYYRSVSDRNWSGSR